MHETIAKSLKVCPTICISHVVLSTIISYYKCDINVLAIEIELCAIIFCIKTIETSYPVMEKITGN